MASFHEKSHRGSSVQSGSLSDISGNFSNFSSTSRFSERFDVETNMLSGDDEGRRSLAARSPVERPDNTPSWRSDEERRVLRKIDLSVLPLLTMGLLVFQLDRMNIASALTAGFKEDIGVDQNTINLGNQLMYMGVLILDIPSNMWLQRFGPRIWLTLQVLAFGLTATMQIFLRDRTGFLVSRVFLGLAEAAYIPSAMYTLSVWYKKRELSKRIGIFFFGMFGANAVSPLLATGILKLHGRGGVRGWQWLFLVEGIITMVMAAILFLLLPGSPQVPKPLGSRGIITFSKTEQTILQKRLEFDDRDLNNPSGRRRIPLSVVWKTITHYRRWPHFISIFTVFSTASPLFTYTPSIIMDLGFDRTAANALAAVGVSMALLVILNFAYLSDRFNQRGLVVLLAQMCYFVTVLVTRFTQSHVGKWSRWGLWTAVNAFGVGYHPVQNSWLQLNCRDPDERSITIAMFVIFGQSGLMVGAQYFRGGDGPLYNKGMDIMLAMISIGMVSTLAQMGVYLVHNRRISRGQIRPQDGDKPRVYTI